MLRNERCIRFRDRQEAGEILAERLAQIPMHDPIVLALPRGGVAVGLPIAQALGAPLDVLVVRKIGAPHHPEFGVGAIAPGGVRVLDEQVVNLLGIPQELLEEL
ncbi:MAG: phosphoribosyltransferase, partial [Burkholderiales bacterium]